MTQSREGSRAPGGAGPTRRVTVLAALVAAGLCMAVLVVTSNRASVVSRGPSNPVVLESAWAIVNNPQASEAQLAEAESLARQALAREPLLTNGATLIATIRDRQGRDDEAEALMRKASSLNHRSNVADLWLFRAHLDARRYEEAFLHADALLRRQTEFTEQLFPLLARTMNDPSSIPPLGERLAKQPSWRMNFLQGVIFSHPDPAAPFGLMQEIKAAGGELTPIETRVYLARLIRDQLYEEAYLAWLLFLPDDISTRVTHIYDGDFDSFPDAQPFGWNFFAGARGSIEAPTLHGRPDDPALYVYHDGVTQVGFPGQLLVLPPGRYVLSGEVLTETPESGDRFSWLISCVGSAQPLLRTTMPDTDDRWREFAQAFVVPTGCEAQQLELVAVRDDRRVDIRAWFDKISVEPEQGAAS